MRIERVTAHAFGPFSGQSLELAPGMTVVHGPNEAGKSSWHAALFAGLCGMRRGKGGRRTEDRRFIERHRPWDGEGWEASVVVRLADGRQVELRHDLDGKVDARATDLLTGRDVSSEVMHDGAPDGARFLGLSRETLPATICVRQAELLSVRDGSADLQEQLQRAAATAGSDGTAEGALELLRSFHATNVGLERRNAARPLMNAVRAAEEARSALETARSSHEEHQALLTERDRLATDARRARAERDAARAALATRAVEALEERLARARALAAIFPEGPPPEPGDDGLAETVASALAAFRACPPAPPPLDGQSAAEVAAEIRSLPDPPDGDTRPHPEVVAAREAWAQAAQSLAFHGSRKPPGPGTDPEPPLAPGPEAADGDEAVTRAPGARLAARALAAAGGAVTALGAGLALAGTGPAAWAPALVAGLVLFAAGWHAARRPDPEAAAEAARAEARRVLSEERRAHAEQERRRWQEQADALGEQEAAAQERLRAALRDRGVVEPGAGAASLFTRYEAACQERASQAARAERRTHLQEVLRARQATEEAAAAATRQREAATAALRDAAAAAGVHAEASPEELMRALGAWRARRAQAEKEAQEARSAWTELENLLEGRSLEDFARQVDQARAELPAAPEGASTPAEVSAGDVARLDQELERAQSAADDAAGAVRAVEARLPSVAEAEEALDRAEAELVRVRALAATLERTRRFLEDARDRVHRDIAPVLNEAMRRWLPDVTAGRYAEALIDPNTLDVRVRAEDGAWREALRLSHGTAEQVYLLLRMAMAEHLVTTGESAPLILDDVTTHADEARTEAVLDLLQRVSADRQVILFSQEREVLAWARDNLTGDGDALIELDPALVAP